MAFKPVTSAAPAPEGPLDVFDELPRMTGAIPELWRPQGAVLRDYVAEKYAGKPDVAIELPTGTGKTVVGLLIAEWRKRKYQRPVAYACPTHQLAHQVAAAARREGVESVTLVGKHTTWSDADVSRYESAEAIAVTTYNAVFNASPKLGSPATLIFDDAHAGEQFVAESWSLVLKRTKYPETWAAMVTAIQGGLDGMFLQRLTSPSADPGAYDDVRLIVPSRRPGMVEAIDAALTTLTKYTPAWWTWTMISRGLASCLVYVAYDEILIRPFVPPTSENKVFSGAKQRLYLSATLGRGGELERAFGRTPITRLPLPADARNPRSGRRYFIFGDLAKGDPGEVARSVTVMARKALVLAPSTRKAKQAAADVNRAGWPILDKTDIVDALATFKKSDEVLLALAGRYDGIDLPDNACRLVVLQGLPNAAHLQERFLARNLRARAALEERTRTRVVQGAGRATRNPSDHAIVLVRGHELSRYLANPERREALNPDLQAEISFGLENSRDVPADDVLDNTKIFLEQGDDWRDQAEPYITDAQRLVERKDPAGSSQLAAAAPFEVEACRSAWRGDYVGARDAAHQAATALSGEESIRTYRSFWLYLAAVWSFAATGKDAAAKRTGVGLLQEAHKTARGTTWLREVDPGDVDIEIDADDTPAVRVIAERIASGYKRGQLDKAVEAISTGLESIAHQRFEPALTELGKLLGADAYKPAGQGQCDSVWCWDERMWVAIEAKTEHKADDGEIPLRDIRQANTQLDSIANDRGVQIPELSISVIVTPWTRVDPTAVPVANRTIHLTTPEVFQAIARDTQATWDQLMIRHHGFSGADLESLVRRTLAEHRVLPTQLRERLTSDPIGAF